MQTLGVIIMIKYPLLGAVAGATVALVLYWLGAWYVQLEPLPAEWPVAVRSAHVLTVGTGMFIGAYVGDGLRPQRLR